MRIFPPPYPLKPLYTIYAVLIALCVPAALVLDYLIGAYPHWFDNAAWGWIVIFAVLILPLPVHIGYAMWLTARHYSPGILRFLLFNWGWAACGLAMLGVIYAVLAAKAA